MLNTQQRLLLVAVVKETTAALIFVTPFRALLLSNVKSSRTFRGRARGMFSNKRPDGLIGSIFGQIFSLEGGEDHYLNNRIQVSNVQRMFIVKDLRTPRAQWLVISIDEVVIPSNTR